MSIWQFKLLGGLNFCQFEVPSLVLFVSTSCHWGLFGKGCRGPVWSMYLTHPNLQIYIFLLPRRYHSSRSLCQQLTLVVLSFPVFCGNWHRFCSKWRSGSLMTFPLFFASHSRISSPGPSEPKVHGGGGGGRMPNMKTICGKTPAVVWRDTFEHVRETFLRVLYARNYKKCNPEMYSFAQVVLEAHVWMSNKLTTTVPSFHVATLWK